MLVPQQLPLSIQIDDHRRILYKLIGLIFLDYYFFLQSNFLLKLYYRFLSWNVGFGFELLSLTVFINKLQPRCIVRQGSMIQGIGFPSHNPQDSQYLSDCLRETQIQEFELKRFSNSSVIPSRAKIKSLLLLLPGNHFFRPTCSSKTHKLYSFWNDELFYGHQCFLAQCQCELHKDVMNLRT